MPRYSSVQDMEGLISKLVQFFNRVMAFIFGHEVSEQEKQKNAYNRELPKVKLPPKSEAAPQNYYQKRLEQLSQPEFWNWNSFREIIINLVKIGEGNYLPATNVPKFIFIDGLLPVIPELLKISEAHNGVETSRVILVDRDRSSLIQSGKTRIGTTTSVLMDYSTEKGREYSQTPVLAIHLHPRMPGSEVFSDNDYLAFLMEPRLIVMVVSNEKEVVFAMKTTATRSTRDVEEIRKHISSSQKDILEIWKGLSLPMPELAFNKAICMEYGLVLYKVDGARKNMARHISVVM